MDPILMALTETNLPPQGIALFVTLYARSQNGLAEMPEDEAAARLGVSPSRLRGYRSQINGTGLGEISLRKGTVRFSLAPHLRAHSDQSDQHVITFAPATNNSDASQRAYSDHSDQIAREVISDPTPTEKVITERALRANSDQSDHHSRANGAVGGGLRGGRLVGIDPIPPSGEKILPTNLPVSVTVKLEPWEAQATEGLLLAMGIQSVPAIRTIAQTVPFEEVRAHALAWQRDTKAEGPGALLNRIRSESFATPILTDSDRHSSLFLSHRTPAEIAEAQRVEAEIAENDRRIDQERAERDARRLAQAQAQAQQTPASPSPSTDSLALATTATAADAKEVWQMALNELSASMSAPTFETWVRDTDVLRYSDGELEIGVPHAYARDWLRDRLQPIIKRTLGRLLQRSVEVTFTVRPRQQEEQCHE